MPALSPTMETGSISNWLVKEGEKFDAGQAVCEVETDKATVTYDAQDEGWVAKILATAGDIKVGQPIFIQVDNKDDCAAFTNYKIAATASTPDIPVPSTPAPIPAASTPAPIPAPSTPEQPNTPTPVSAPTPVQHASHAKSTQPTPSSSSSSSISLNSVYSIQYGTGVAKTSLTNKLSADQALYIKKYGRSAMKPLAVK